MNKTTIESLRFLSHTTGTRDNGQKVGIITYQATVLSPDRPAAQFVLFLEYPLGCTVGQFTKGLEEAMQELEKQVEGQNRLSDLYRRLALDPSSD